MKKSGLKKQLSGSGVFFYIKKLAILVIFRTFWYIELYTEIEKSLYSEFGLKRSSYSYSPLNSNVKTCIICPLSLYPKIDRNVTKT